MKTAQEEIQIDALSAQNAIQRASRVFITGKPGRMEALAMLDIAIDAISRIEKQIKMIDKLSEIGA